VRGHIRRRGKDSWAIVLYLGRDPVTGKDRHKWHALKGTKKDAQRELVRLLNQVHSGAYAEPSRETLGKFLARWLEDRVKATVSSSTYREYAGTVERYLAPRLGGARLDRVRPDMIQAALAALQATGGVEGRALSPATVIKARAVLSQACGWATKIGLVARNPVGATDAPRRAGREMQVWTPEEARRFLDAARESRYSALYVLALTTGLRQAELLGLRWADIDWEHETVRVNRILYRGNVKEPKTPHSRRTVDLPISAVEALRQHRVRQAEEKLRLGPVYAEGEWVFATAAGTPLCARNLVQRDFEPLQTRARVPRIRFHDLRHSHATHLLAAGVPVKVVQERLGHARPGITLDVYGHVLPGAGREAARRVDAILGGTDAAARR